MSGILDTSASVGFWPRDLITVNSSCVVEFQESRGIRILSKCYDDVDDGLPWWWLCHLDSCQRQWRPPWKWPGRPRSKIQGFFFGQPRWKRSFHLRSMLANGCQQLPMVVNCCPWLLKWKVSEKGKWKVRALLSFHVAHLCFLFQQLVAGNFLIM